MLNRLSFHRNRSTHSLKRKLFLYMFLLMAILLFSLIMGLFLLKQFINTKRDLFKSLDLQMEVFSKNMDTYWDDVVARNIILSTDMSALLEYSLDEQGLSFDDLLDNDKAINRVQDTLIEPLCQHLRQSNCSGAFVLLNTTVNSHIADSDTTRSGLYIQKSSTGSSDCALLLYHGIAQIGKNHKVMPHRKWRLEFNTDLLPNYEKHFTKEYPTLDTSYRLSDLILLPGTSENISLMTVPLLGSDGTLYGLCGFEVSQTWFKAKHSQPSNLNHLLCILTRSGDTLNADIGFSSGIQNGYYFAPKGNLSVAELSDGLVTLSSENEDYVGITREYQLTLNNDPFTLVVMIPRSDYHHAMVKSHLQVTLLVLLILFFGSVCCLYFSRRFLSPVLKGLEQIRARKNQRTPSEIPEIDDLLDFLAQKDQEAANTILCLEEEMQQHKDELDRLQAKHDAIQRDYEVTQAEVSRLAYSRKNEVDPLDYQHFLDCLTSLTPKEKTILDLYIQGKTSKDILQIANIGENTLKYHNRNIYSKLGVKSRKQLLMYAALMKQTEN